MLAKTMMMAAALFLAAADATAQRRPAAPDPSSRLAAIERASGGRLGVALIDARGHTLFANRANERFAMCSTFKLPLAAMFAQTAGARIPMSFTRAELVPNSPFAARMLGNADRGRMRVGFAAEHAVTESDNTAANLLLRRLGGPEEYTRRLRAWGDNVTRLDRHETILNENARDDPRDTTSPAAMAATTRLLVMGTPLQQTGWRNIFRGWLVAARTGPHRIRAGIPATWTMGHKTGTCGNAVNDVAFFRTPRGHEYVLAVYVDRPANDARGERAIADVARLAAGLAR